MVCRCRTLSAVISDKVKAGMLSSFVAVKCQPELFEGISNVKFGLTLCKSVIACHQMVIIA